MKKYFLKLHLISASLSEMGVLVKVNVLSTIVLLIVFFVLSIEFLLMT
ncbi:hypothetical protein [Flavobacterium faecale]